MNLPAEIAASQRLIVALDFDTAGEARSLVDGLGDTVGFYKVGWQLFLGAGWPFVEDLLEAGKKVFLDLKIGDIGNTVRAAVGNMPDHFAGRLQMLTLQGGRATVQAAVAGRGERTRPWLLMLTVLSSMDDADLGGPVSGRSRPCHPCRRDPASGTDGAGCRLRGADRFRGVGAGPARTFQRPAVPDRGPGHPPRGGRPRRSQAFTDPVPGDSLRGPTTWWWAVRSPVPTGRTTWRGLSFQRSRAPCRKGRSSRQLAEPRRFQKIRVSRMTVSSSAFTAWGSCGMRYSSWPAARGCVAPMAVNQVRHSADYFQQTSDV